MSFSIENPDKPTIVKDPEAVLDYCWDFTDLIDPDDPIQEVTFPTVTKGIVVDSFTVQGAKVWAFLSGGMLGATAAVTCRYVSQAGRTDDRTLYFKIKPR